MPTTGTISSSSTSAQDQGAGETERNVAFARIIPAQAGSQDGVADRCLDPRLRGNDFRGGAVLTTRATRIVGAGLAALLWAVMPRSTLASETHCPERHEGSRLTTVTLFDGPPSEHADLVPDKFHEGTSGARSEWSVAYIFEAGRRLFVRCQYGRTGSSITLEPDTSTATCEFLTRGGKDVSLTCRSG